MKIIIRNKYTTPCLRILNFSSDQLCEFTSLPMSNPENPDEPFRNNDEEDLFSRKWEWE